MEIKDIEDNPDNSKITELEIYDSEEYMRCTKSWIENWKSSEEFRKIGASLLQALNTDIELYNTIKSLKFSGEDFESIPNYTSIEPQFQQPYKDFIKFLIANKHGLCTNFSTYTTLKTFAIPSHSLMFSLLALFAGKPEKIPTTLLEKSHSERTPEEQKAAEKYLNKIFETSREIDYSEGYEKVYEKKTALICNNATVEGRAEISWSLFQKDISFREERLAKYIKRTFGPEGIRHLLGLIIGLEENGRTGSFEWSVNDHLERLGYKKKACGSYDIELRKMASEIVKIFTGLCITSIRKKGKKDSIYANFLFMVQGYGLEAFEKEIIDEKIKLTATDFWYQNALSPVDGQAPKYTKLLQDIVKENHREHPLTLYLAPLLAIFWRMNPEKKISIRNLMEWCDLDTGKYKLRGVRELQASLEYMQIKGYLGDWEHNGEYRILADNKDVLDICLVLNPPYWLNEELELIDSKRIAFRKERTQLVTHEELLQIIEESGLTDAQFGQSIGTTKPYISMLKAGKRKISQKISQKIREFVTKKVNKKLTKSTSLSHFIYPS
jgi:hypothetical protein